MSWKAGFDEATAEEWARTNYALGQTVIYLKELFKMIDGLECPSTPGLNEACATMKNFARISSLTVLVVAEKAHDISVYQYEESFGISEFAMHEMSMNVDVLYSECFRGKGMYFPSINLSVLTYFVSLEIFTHREHGCAPRRTENH